MGPGDLQEITQGLNEELGPDAGPYSELNQLGQEATATAAGGDPFSRRRRDPAVLVSTETGDDAGVYLVRPEGPAGIGIVQTADFITPPFDDPEGYGQIAAANALSDVYAMGGRPISALNLCVFPPGLVTASARAILRGASDKLREAGVATILVEQRVESALHVADRILFVENGRSAETVLPAMLREDPTLLHHYVGVGLRK